MTKADSLRCVSPMCAVDCVDQLRQAFWGGAVCKCDTHKALDFPTFWFGTRRSMVQIHSPRPFFSLSNQCAMLRSQLQLQVYFYEQYGQQLWFCSEVGSLVPSKKPVGSHQRSKLRRDVVNQPSDGKRRSPQEN